MRRKAQFFIITVILVSGSLAMTLDVLDDYDSINYDQVSASRAPSQFKSFERTLSSAWFNEMWKFRTGFAVAERSGTYLEEFPVNFTLNTSRMIERGRMQPDCSDLRATDETGEEIPLQIAEGECGSQETDVWALVDLESNGFATVYFYYGNDRIEKPDYDTDLEFEDLEGPAVKISNSFMNLKYNRTEIDGTEYCGFTEVGNNYRPDLFEEGTAIEKFTGDCGSDFSMEEGGNVYTRFTVDGTEYMFFARNGFLRREGRVVSSLDSFTSSDTDEGVYIGETSSPDFLDSWLAGNEDNTHPVYARQFIRNNNFGGNPDVLSLPASQSYIGVYDSETEDGLFLTAKQNGELQDFQALFQGYSDGDSLQGTHHFYMGNRDQESDIPYIDFVISSTDIPHAKLRAHVNPPSVVEDQQVTVEEGRFYPSSGWNYRTGVKVDNDGSEFLYNDPVNVSVNLADLDIRNASNLVIMEEGRSTKHKIWKENGGHDIYDYTHPGDFQMRFPMEEGRGRMVNGTGTVTRYYSEFVDSPEWDIGSFGTGLDLSEGSLVEGDGSLSINPQDGTSFTLSFWIREEDYSSYPEGFHRIFEYSQDSPGLGIEKEGGDTGLKATFYNHSRMYPVENVTGGSGSLDQPGWHHLALVYEGEDEDRMELFLDGEMIDSAQLNDGDFIPFQAPGVDNPVYRIAEGFRGLMDEFKFYPRALDEKEIAHQQNQLSTITFLTNSSPGTSSSDIKIYSEGNSGFTDDTLSETYISSQGYSDSVRAKASVPKSFESVVDHFLEMIRGTRIANSIDIEYVGKCVKVEFSSSIFRINKMVC
mgnify:CR=1 FL=1